MDFLKGVFEQERQERMKLTLKLEWAEIEETDRYYITLQRETASRPEE